MMMAYSGRVTVINSLLSSVAIYIMCSIKVPAKILLEHIEKIRRHCLWNKKTDDGEKCNSLTAWKEVCGSPRYWHGNCCTGHCKHAARAGTSRLEQWIGISELLAQFVSSPQASPKH